MSTFSVYPDGLKASAWEKDKKSGFDPKSELAVKLKALQKKHEAVDWKLFAEGWTQSAKTAAELEAEGSRRHKTCVSTVLPLKKEAQAVLQAVKAAEKMAEKPLLATLKSLAKRGDDYVEGVDTFADAIKLAFDKAMDAFSADENEDEDSAPSALVNPKTLFKQLSMCRKDPERTVKFAFVDGNGKDQAAMLALHPRMSARALFGKLQAAAGVRTGAYGSAWVDGTSLMLQLDKPLSGLVKKVRGPVKECGFRISKAVLWTETGEVFEEDGDAPSATTGANTPTPGTTTTTTAPAPPQASAAYDSRLGALRPRVAKAGPEAVKHQALLDFAAAKAKSQDYPGALAALKRLEAMLDAPQPGNESAGDKMDEAKARLDSPGFDEAAFRAAWQPVREGWRDAVETVDGQIAKLQSVLRIEADEDLREIAEFGLPALTGNFKAPMMAALMDVDRASGAALPKAARRARALAASFAEYLDEAETVAVTDDNDFGVTVSIRKTIGGALRQLETTLAAAAAAA